MTIAVAVLLTHMLRNAVTAMIPAMTRRGLDPAKRNTLRASRASRPQTFIPRASRNPPRKRKIRGWA